MKQRFISITTPQSGYGTACPSSPQNGVCNKPDCPVDCISSWSSWGSCDVPCGLGNQHRTLNVVTAAANGGTACPSPNTETTGCTVAAPCPGPPENCDSNWNPWGDCDVTCGSGIRQRTLDVVTPALNGGIPCPTPTTQTTGCTMSGCPVNCGTSWTTWGSCDVTCGSGNKQRDLFVVTAAANGGTPCPALTSETTACVSPVVCPVDCVYSWNSWGSCNITCGTGAQERIITITTPESGGGLACPSSPEIQSCNYRNCPVDCKLGPWGNYTECSATCGDKLVKYRTREIEVEPAYGGQACGELTEEINCDFKKCVSFAFSPVILAINLFLSSREGLWEAYLFHLHLLVVPLKRRDKYRWIELKFSLKIALVPVLMQISCIARFL